MERTFPGSVRYFSIDYMPMVLAVYMWLIFDVTGGIRMLWVLLASAGPQLVLAVHCTFSSPDKSVPLSVAYIASGIVWTLLWFPSQSAWLSGCTEGSTKNQSTLNRPHMDSFMQLACTIPVSRVASGRAFKAPLVKACVETSLRKYSDSRQLTFYVCTLGRFDWGAFWENPCLRSPLVPFSGQSL